MNNKNYDLQRFKEFTEFCKNNLVTILDSAQNSQTNVIERFKKGHKIKIKKENKGKFTEYCNGKVTEACIQKGKNSKDPKIRKRATFAANARTWNH